MLRTIFFSMIVMLPSAVMAEIISARFEAPTERYPHGVLGDTTEYGALRLTLDDGQEILHVLNTQSVFEDLEPRLADVDMDGLPEVIVFEAHNRLGAQLAIYDEAGKDMATPHIGTRFRWLAPVAAADLDGDGQTEIAYIETPHLGKTLRIWRVVDGRLVSVTSRTGLTNHRIGEDFITSAFRNCAGERPTLITVDARWQRIMRSQLQDDRIVTKDAGAYRGYQSVVSLGICE